MLEQASAHDGAGIPLDLVIVTQGEALLTDQKGVVRYEIFRGRLTTWDQVFADAAEYATRVGPDRLISISHSHDGIVAVWYWSSEVIGRG